MQPFQCDLQAQIPKHPITTHTQAHPKQLEATVTLRPKKKANRPQPHPPHRRGTFHRRLQPLYTEKHKVSCSGFLPKTEPLQHHAAIPMRSASTDSKTPYNYAHTSTPKAAWSHRYNAAKKKGKPTAAAPAAQTRYLSSPAAATLHGKTQGFVLRLPPENRPLQHHAAIPMRSASTDSKTPYNYAHTSTPKAAWSHRYNAAKKKGKPTAAAPAAQTRYLSSPAAATLRKNTTFRAPASSPKQSPCNIMQPFQCDLQARIPKHPITTHTQAHPKQLEATVTMRQKKKANRPQPHPPHRQGTFHRRLQPLYTEKHKVSCSGFLPKTEPLQHHAAIPMRSASTDSKTPYNYAHTSTPKAAWSHRYNAAKKKRQTDRSRTRRTDEVPFIAGCSHFTRKNTRFRAPASSRKQTLATSCSHSNAICKHRFQNTL